MRARIYVLIASTAIAVGSTSHTYAGVGGLMMKAGRTLFGKSSKVAGRTGKVVRSGGRAAASAGGRATTGALVTGAKVTAANASRIVTSRLGAAGTRAMAKLGSAGKQKLAEMSSLLARSPYKAGWLETIAKHGSAAVDFLWRHKAGIAVGTFATAAVLRPAEFLETIEGMTTATVNATGEFVIKPVISGTTEHVIGPAVSKVVEQASPGRWFFPLMTSLVIAGAFWWKLRPASPF